MTECKSPVLIHPWVARPFRKTALPTEVDVNLDRSSLPQHPHYTKVHRPRKIRRYRATVDWLRSSERQSVWAHEKGYIFNRRNHRVLYSKLSNDAASQQELTSGWCFKLLQGNVKLP